MKLRTFMADEALWKRAGAAALRESLETGERVSLSEWIRRAMRDRLEDVAGRR